MRPNEPTDAQRAETIGALLKEREGYEARGDAESAAGVSDQLRLLGHGVKRADRARNTLRRGGQAR